MTTGITIVGLGPGAAQHWTLAAAETLRAAETVYLRTAHHPSVAEIPAQYISFDERFSQATNFSMVYDEIAAEIIKRGKRPQGVVYAVPGHPHVGEATVPRIEKLAAAENLPLTIIPGLSFIEPTLSALGLNGLANLQLADAVEISQLYHPPLNPDYPALIGRMYGPAGAQQLQTTLRNAYPAQFEVTLVRAVGTPQQQIWSCPLADLAEQPQLDEWVTLYLPADEQNNSLITFQNTVAHLRSPEGCPWDIEQTHQTLRPNLLEETFEALEALDENDMAALSGELGDVLLQIVLHTQIATKNDAFNMGDVIGQIQRKMLRRHPHVFGDVEVSSTEEVLDNWERIKKTEQANQADDRPPRKSALDGVPTALPALAQALTISKKAVRAGFEWANMAGVLEKIVEEAHEVAEATEYQHLESEIGDLLFMVVNLARWRNIDPESALRSTNARFTERFQLMEQLAAEQGQSLKSMSLPVMQTLWEQAKKQQKQKQSAAKGANNDPT